MTVPQEGTISLGRLLWPLMTAPHQRLPRSRWEHPTLVPSTAACTRGIGWGTSTRSTVGTSEYSLVVTQIGSTAQRMLPKNGGKMPVSHAAQTPHHLCLMVYWEGLDGEPFPAFVSRLAAIQSLCFSTCISAFQPTTEAWPSDQFELLYDLIDYSDTPMEGLDGAPTKALASHAARVFDRLS